ncbi:hypothetical protein N7462_006006 [Penicillium macrosclerotiorum]|uniref:uncharacterized protein n=1 Tax=Penicillium macrosclerotiorum TaxID=303699 RepID=UPI002547EBFE|nr:uncharacterized protein N7462_006006 [Penicillium macrosclerotiorum]KAJ5682841.1 hypothetical protein N7462_006006 [Penicillium macrosclerotiorum]
MSPPSPKKKSGGAPSGPRQIRFVATDGQPQTKRRRVNAAFTLVVSPVAGARFVVRENSQSLADAHHPPLVCKTCSDYKHVCLGYTESTAHLRSQSDSASRAPAVPPPTDSSQRTNRAVESCSPEPPPAPVITPKVNTEKSPQVPKQTVPKDGSSRDTTTRTNKESDSLAAGDSPESSRTSMSSSNRTHVPYFRYFGPTAIVPGFKQMVVQVRGSRKSNPSMSSESLSPLRSPKPSDVHVGLSAPTADTRDTRDSNTIPFYDRDDALAVPNLVYHLCDLFFAHLGCNFPFLQRDRFLQDLKEKKVDTMLVDAVCALAARFSPHPLLGPPQAPPIDRSQPPVDIRLWDRGLPFAHRAMSALVDSLSCPTLSAVQACLLLAYEQFGSNHDSGLWMYLGISIRMAQDLGLQKLQGLKHNYGQKGVTPSEVMTGQAGKLREDQYDDLDIYQSPKTHPPAFGTERARERERVDSFWSIFFLDRVISSGTGRPVTLRDEDIELCFPLQSESQLPNGWPAPFPPLIRIIHLYGRVTDLINGIQDVNHVTSDTLKRLAGMESDLTGIYQRLSPKLHFNAANFQAYVKAKEGTNFILLHFWFHTLIVLLHQPTLLNSFGGTIQHLYPNSRELSMSSAKTIADILSFSELVDGKSFIGNPFTSQPMYIAACAFLMESAHYSSPSSRSASPPPQPLLTNQSSGFVMPTMESSNGSERKSTAKHILLASAAKENYQRCYKALKALNTYWEGTRYILTVLDQKAKGIVDPLLYTAEDMENAAEILPVQTFGSAGWGASRASDSNPGAERPPAVADIPPDGKWSPKIDPSQAIGWALTGATNSSQPNLSLLYQMPSTHTDAADTNKPAYSSQYSHSYPALPVQTNSAHTPNASFPQAVQPTRAHEESRRTPLATANAKISQVPSCPIGAESPYYLGTNSTYPESNVRISAAAQSTYGHGIPSPMDGHPSAYPYPVSSAAAVHHTRNPHMGSHGDLHPSMTSHTGGMMIESHDVDMNTLQQQESFPFNNGEILPWLEYLPQDVLSFFGESQNYPIMSPDDATPRHQ